jgi:hypothetical protein
MSQEVLGNGAPVADNFSPSSMTQGYAEGGLVQERIDSGTGPNWTNSVGYADPSAQYASARESMQDEFKNMRGPKLQAEMGRRADDLTELADLKSRADSFEKTGLAPWEQPQNAPSAIGDLGLGSQLNYQDSGPGGARPPSPPPEDPNAQPLSFRQRKPRPLGLL